MRNIITTHGYKYTWLGVRDVAGNDVYVSMGTGTVIEDNSPIWDGCCAPRHGNNNCMYAYGYDSPPGIYDNPCHRAYHTHICEVFGWSGN